MGKNKCKRKSVDDLYIGYSNIKIKKYYEKVKIKVDEINKQFGENIMFLNDAYSKANYEVYDNFISFDYLLDDEKLNVLLKCLIDMNDKIILEERINIVKKAIKLKKASQ